MDLALGLRNEIVEDYKEDESPKNIPPEFLQEMTLLVIDMSLPTIQRTIDLMQNYKSISTLVITGGKNGATVNLPDLLTRAAKFPLKNLYIINFREFVTTIPEQVNQFKSLSTLAIYNNKISQLPNMSGCSAQLDSLFVDANPVATLFPVVSSMSKLKALGIAKTSVSPAEVNKIESLLPKCKILSK
jgi:Leucine-rich repeat (LRR) protein